MTLAQGARLSQPPVNYPIAPGSHSTQIWEESPAVLILGSKPNTAFANNNVIFTKTRSAGAIPLRASSMEGWLDLVNGAGLYFVLH